MYTVYRDTATTACVKVLTSNQWKLIIAYISAGNVNFNASIKTQKKCLTDEHFTAFHKFSATLSYTPQSK